MKHLVCLVAALALIAGSTFSAPSNKDCPMCDKSAVAGHETNYSKTVALCCTKCKAKFDENPKGYLSTILTAHSGQCPLSKKAITSPVNVTYARQVGFCSAECKAKFQESPDKYIKDVR